MLISEKITLILSIWVLIALIITGDSNFEIFFILIFLGVLIARELTDVFTTFNFKDRINILIYMFIIVFIVIVGQKIINILSI